MSSSTQPYNVLRQSAVLAGALLALCLVVAAGWLRACDEWIMQQLQTFGNRPLDVALFILTLLGSIEVTTIAWLVVSAVLWRRSRRAACWFTGLFVAATLVELALKQTIPQARIPVEFDRNPWRVHQHLHTNYSFPSGHTLRTFYLLTALAWLTTGAAAPARRRRITVALWTVLTLVAVSRVYLGDHWPSDVAGGALLAGLALAWLRPQFDSLPAKD